MSVLRARRAEALPVVEAVPNEEDFYDFEARYEIGRTEFVCPAGCRRRRPPRAQELALVAVSGARLHGFARVDLMLDEARASCPCSRPTTIPGLTDTSLLPQAADAAGIAFDELVGRVLELRTRAAPSAAEPRRRPDRPA